MREIAPLLKNRQLFAESHNFVMYDFWAGENNVNENVFVYSNRVDHGGAGWGGSGKERAVIFYNNAYQSTHGTIHVSVADMDKSTGQLRQRTLSDALHLPSDPNLYLAWRDSASNLEYLRRSTDFDHHGFSLELRGYQYAVLGDWRELYATAERPWDQLAGVLGGGGVHSLDDALLKLRLRPLHEALRHAISPETLREVAASCCTLSSPAEIAAGSVETPAGVLAGDEIHDIFAEERKVVPQPVDPPKASEVRCSTNFLVMRGYSLSARFASSARAETLLTTRSNESDAKFRTQVRIAACLPSLERKFASSWPQSAIKVLPNRKDQTAHEGAGQAWAPVLAWLMIESMASNTGGTIALFDRLQLRSGLSEAFRSVGVEGDNVWRMAARIRVLLANPKITTAAQLASPNLWEDPDFRWLACLSQSSSVTYVNKECFEEMVWWLQLPRLLAEEDTTKIQALVVEAAEAAKTAGYDLAKLRDLLVAKASAAPAMTVADTQPESVPASKLAEIKAVEEEPDSVVEEPVTARR